MNLTLTGYGTLRGLTRRARLTGIDLYHVEVEHRSGRKVLYQRSDGRAVHPLHEDRGWEIEREDLERLDREEKTR